MNPVLFADARVKELSSAHTLPAKFQRLLERLDLSAAVKDRRVAVKMHLGGNLGFTTIHPLFVRLLTAACRDAGARSVAVMDGAVDGAVLRGYTPESIGAPLVSCFGWSGEYLYEKEINFLELKTALYGGNAWDADVFIDLSHIKGHGMCGFGGAIKNIAMGCTAQQTRGDIHRIQGGIVWDGEKCTHCGKCIKECPNHVNLFDDRGNYQVNWHDCTYCQHCTMICPTGALTADLVRFEAFQEALARVAAVFLNNFPPEQRLFINIITNVTIYCDCWGMSTPALIPDVGILAGNSIVAVEKATLDLIDADKLMIEGLPLGTALARDQGHLFERIHGKNPYLQIEKLAELGFGPADYELVAVE